MNLLIVLVIFFSMEGLTWVIHKYIMHGFLWVLHKDHHDSGHESKWEQNDYFFLIFATPALTLMYFGSRQGFNYLFYLGMGISLYGMAYFIVHDIFIHQRIKLLTHTRNGYFLAIRRAHKQHHKHIGKKNGECFGFLWVPVKYIRLYFKRRLK